MRKAPTDPLWQRLRNFRFDETGARLGFSARLARENAWSMAYAKRVIEEYKRFCYLALKSGHPVTPSDQVDQAWHLHLVYTESYWHRLCGEVLGAPLHHGPTRGGTDENAKFRDWYSATLVSYQQHFGPPPADIWPEPAARFLDAGAFHRVNAAQYWVLPKPALRAGLKRLVLPGLAAGLTLAACAAQAAVGFDLEAETMLFGMGLLLCLLFVLLCVSVIRTARRKARRKDGTGCGAGCGAGCGGCGSKGRGKSRSDNEPGGGDGADSGCGGGCGGGCGS